MDEKKISVKELLKQIAEEIEAIRVPVALADEISRPLCRNLYLLHQCIDAMKDEAPGAGQEEENVQGES